MVIGQQEVMRYLQQERGLSEETIQTFGLRYEPQMAIVPVHDPYGEEVGHQVRSITSSFKTNSVGFHAHSVLFNLHRAKSAVVEEGSVLVVEGPFDVMHSWQVGRKNVVGLLGNRIGRVQALLLARYTLSAILCLDDDEGGEVGSAISSRLLRELGFSVSDLKPSQGKDLAEAEGVTCPILSSSRL